MMTKRVDHRCAAHKSQALESQSQAVDAVLLLRPMLCRSTLCSACVTDEQRHTDEVGVRVWARLTVDQWRVTGRLVTGDGAANEASPRYGGRHSGSAQHSNDRGLRQGGEDVCGGCDVRRTTSASLSSPLLTLTSSPAASEYLPFSPSPSTLASL
jgi:hypothetical protein